jgi:hypothetical protein
MEFGMDPELIWREKKQKRLVGVKMGADAATEHECGIQPILYAFRGESYSHYSTIIPDDFSKEPPFGVDARKVTHVPTGKAGFLWFKTKQSQGFGYNLREDQVQFWDDRGGYRQLLSNEIKPLVCAWQDDRFLCLGRDEKTIDTLAKIYAAVQAKDAMFTIAPGFMISEGLCILIVSKLPKQYVNKLYNSDKQRWLNKKAFHETGIEQELSAAGKRWFALSRYQEFDNGEWRVWLNPMEQHIHNAGWFTIEELKQWAQNTGPVMKGEQDAR